MSLGISLLWVVLVTTQVPVQIQVAPKSFPVGWARWTVV